MKRLIPAIAATLLICGCNSAQKQDDQESGAKIKADQIGYPTKGVKIALVPDSSAKEFTIVDFATGEEVYKGQCSEPKEWEFSGTKVKTADFSDFNREGIFRLKCKGTSGSYPFAVGENIYQDLLPCTCGRGNQRGVRRQIRTSRRSLRQCGKNPRICRRS